MATPRFDLFVDKMLAECEASKVESSKSNSLHYASLDIDEYQVFIFCDDASDRKMLTEAKQRGVPIGGIYSAIEHPPRVTPGLKHLHIYARNNEIAAINISGTGHDGWTGVRLPNKVVNGIQQHFPAYRIPPGGILEFKEQSVSDFITILESL